MGLYQKDDLLNREEDPEGKEVTPNNFENPVFNNISPKNVPLTSSQEKPKLDFQPPDDDSTAASGIYETAVDDLKPTTPGEEKFVKVDLGALEVALEGAGPVEDDGMEDYDVEEMFEETTKKGKKKKPRKYDRF